MSRVEPGGARPKVVSVCEHVAGRARRGQNPGLADQSWVGTLCSRRRSRELLRFLDTDVCGDSDVLLLCYEYGDCDCCGYYDGFGGEDCTALFVPAVMFEFLRRCLWPVTTMFLVAK